MLATITDEIISDDLLNNLENLIGENDIGDFNQSIDVGMCWGFCIECSAQCENDASE